MADDTLTVALITEVFPAAGTPLKYAGQVAGLSA